MKRIEIAPWARQSHRFLLKHWEIVPNQQACSVLDFARKKAGEIIKTSQTQAQDLFIQAFKEGFDQGLINVCTAIAEQLRGSIDLVERLKVTVIEQVEARLAEQLKNEDLLLQLIQAALSERMTTQQTIVRLVIPSFIQNPQRFVHLLEQFDLQARLSVNNNDNKFIIECGHQLWVFDASIVAKQIMIEGNIKQLMTTSALTQFQREAELQAKQTLTHAAHSFTKWAQDIQEHISSVKDE